MGLLEIASGKSLWRGYDYFKSGMVKSCDRRGRELSGEVKGSGDNTYDVIVDLDHPKRSTCSCAHAEGKRRVCKHKVALFFQEFPEEAERLMKEAEEYEAEEEKRQQERYEEIHRYVYSLSKQELQEELFWRIVESDERRYW